MVKIEVVEKAIAQYLDDELMPQLADNGIQKLFIGTAISIVIKKMGTITETIMDNKALKTLGIVNDNGEVDTDLLCEEIKGQMPSSGISVDIPIIGKMTFHSTDVEKLQKYINTIAGVSGNNIIGNNGIASQNVSVVSKLADKIGQGR